MFGSNHFLIQSRTWLSSKTSCKCFLLEMEMEMEMECVSAYGQSERGEVERKLILASKNSIILFAAYGTYFNSISSTSDSILSLAKAGLSAATASSSALTAANILLVN